MKKTSYIALLLLFCFSFGVKHSMAQDKRDKAAKEKNAQIDAFVNELDLLAANATKHRYANSKDVDYRMFESALIMNKKIIQALRDKMRLDKIGKNHLSKAGKDSLERLNTKLNLLGDNPTLSIKRVNLINARLRHRMQMYEHTHHK